MWDRSTSHGRSERHTWCQGSPPVQQASHKVRGSAGRWSTGTNLPTTPFTTSSPPAGRKPKPGRSQYCPLTIPPSPLAPLHPLSTCGGAGCFSSRLGRRESAWTCYTPFPSWVQQDQSSPLSNWTMCIKSRGSCLTNHLSGIWKGFSQLDSQEDKLDINLPRDSIRMTFSY